MKYKAIVKLTRDGFKLSLYIKVVFWFHIDGLRPLSENVFFLIDETIEKWKSFYGDKLIIEDCRNND